MNRVEPFISAEHQAELEDRADEQVDRAYLLGLDRDDHAAARAEQAAADRAEFARRANEQCYCRACSDNPGNFSWWRDVL